MLALVLVNANLFPSVGRQKGEVSSKTDIEWFSLV